MSMISELAKGLRKLGNQWRHNDVAAYHLLFDAADTIETLSAKVRANNLHDGWIPCSEREPSEDDGLVLITIRGHDVIRPKDGETVEQAIERIWNEVCYVSVGFMGSDGWYGADGFPQIVHPIAWMPLPKPYKGGDTE